MYLSKNYLTQYLSYVLKRGENDKILYKCAGLSHPISLEASICLGYNNYKNIITPEMNDLRLWEVIVQRWKV